MANESDALIREVQEELRRDKLKKFWDQYGTYAIGALVLVLAGVGGFNWWQASRIASAESAGARFEQALDLANDEKKTDEAGKVLTAIAKEGAPGYGTLAQLTLAGEAVEAGKTDEALKAYEAAAASAADTLLKDYANLQAAALKIESADWTEMQNRLKTLAATTSPWRYRARELLGLAALRAGKLEEARKELAPLSADPKAPVSVRERTGALMQQVVAAESEKSAPKEVALEATAAPPKPADDSKASGDGTKPASMLERLKGGK